MTLNDQIGDEWSQGMDVFTKKNISLDDMMVGVENWRIQTENNWAKGKWLWKWWRNNYIFRKEYEKICFPRYQGKKPVKTKSGWQCQIKEKPRKITTESFSTK